MEQLDKKNWQKLNVRIVFKDFTNHMVFFLSFQEQEQTLT